ncbi:MAG: GNAT family N-acetyltransferase [Phycisphaeraceae bacterium]|nr:GNAT family N-acetyltransferase [Phycisphaeraceae bacterium]
MSHTIIRLTAADYAELLPYLANAFGHSPDDWFARNLPVAYRPTDECMRCNYAIRIDGKIAGVVGLFPFEQTLAGRTWRIAGIGGVSTAPWARKLGLMREIMAKVVADIRQDGYPISWLGGQRQRYRYWGWERAGTGIQIRLNRANLTHDPLWQNIPALKYEPVINDPDLLKQILALHDTQPRHCIRPLDQLFNHLFQWSCRPVYAADESGQVIAYAVIRAGGKGVDELVGRDSAATMGLLRGIIETEGDVGMSFDPMMSPAHKTIVDTAEYVSVEGTGNWQIFNWQEVLDILSNAQAQQRTLAPGQVVLGIEGQNKPLLLSVQGNQATCQPTDRKPDLTADSPTMTRLLFGPLKPSLVMPLPPQAAVLDQWCPLPLYLGRQDGV